MLAFKKKWLQYLIPKTQVFFSIFFDAQKYDWVMCVVVLLKSINFFKMIQILKKKINRVMCL